MELQRGITGIQSTKDPMPVLASTDLKAFRSHCHEAARALGAKVPNIKNRWDGVGICNFAIARFDFSDSNVAVLLNVIHPILAFAKYPAYGETVFEFADCPKLAQLFRSFDSYNVSTSAELNQPLVREMWENLAPQEQKSVRYFRPARVGDLVFNFWD